MYKTNSFRGYVSSFTDYGTLTASSIGTAITTGGSANTKGSYTQLTASTTRDTDLIIINFNDNNASGDAFSVDIAVGSAGNEVVILPDLSVNPYNQQSFAGGFMIPLSIPAGTRLSARAQGTASSDTVNVSAVCGSGNLVYNPFSICTAYGFVSASTTGTVIDPGAIANTKGAWVQLTASTSRDHYGLIWSLDGLAGATNALANILFDIGIGGSGSETVLIPSIQATSSAGLGGIIPDNSYMPIPVQIPAGTRLSVRAQSSNATAASRKFGSILYGLS